MGFIYQEANAYGVEALVALERHYTPTEIGRASCRERV